MRFVGHEDLSTELSCILDKGFVEINKCVFLVVYGVMRYKWMI